MEEDILDKAEGKAISQGETTEETYTDILEEQQKKPTKDSKVENGEPSSEDRIGCLTAMRRTFLFQTLLCILISILEYISIEAFLGDSVSNIGLDYGIRNVAMILLFQVIVSAIFHRVRPALILSTTLVAIIGITNYFIDSFRGYGIVYMDFFAVKTATEVADNYKYTLNQHFYIGIAIIAACLILGTLAPRKWKPYWNKKSNLLSGVTLALSMGVLVWMNIGTGYWGDVSGLSWDHSIGMANYGYLLYATANAGNATVEAPEGYSPEKVDKLLDKYKDFSQSNSLLADHSGDADSPNLIMIMNESFSDLSVLGNLRTNKPYLQFFNSLTENTIRGYAESSVYGGYTSNSEFEFLTGTTKAFLPGNPYLQYIQDYQTSIIDTIKAQGKYKTALAIHPYNASGYNRNRVYPLMGFDEFLSKDDFKNPVKVRKYISDESDYKMIEQKFEEKEEGTSLCLFNVTMQNHGDYDDIKYKFDDPVYMESQHYEFEADQYLSLMRKSDQALEGLIEYFEKVKEPTIIVLFGDHQPHLSDTFYEEMLGKSPTEFTQLEVMKKHLVPFMICANYDIGEQTIERTSLNYLSTIMMQTAGLQLTDYQRYLLDLYQKIPSVSATGYFDQKGSLHYWSEATNAASKLMKEYEMVQYNYLFDKENRNDSHYEISGE